MKMVKTVSLIIINYTVMVSNLLSNKRNLEKFYIIILQKNLVILKSNNDFVLIDMN